MIYCVIPRELADELYDKMVEYYKDNPNVTVIIDRRSGPDRRNRKGGGDVGHEQRLTAEDLHLAATVAIGEQIEALALAGDLPTVSLVSPEPGLRLLLVFQQRQQLGASLAGEGKKCRRAGQIASILPAFADLRGKFHKGKPALFVDGRLTSVMTAFVGSSKDLPDLLQAGGRRQTMPPRHADDTRD